MKRIYEILEVNSKQWDLMHSWEKKEKILNTLISETYLFSWTLGGIFSKDTSKLCELLEEVKDLESNIKNCNNDSKISLIIYILYWVLFSKDVLRLEM